MDWIRDHADALLWLGLVVFAVFFMLNPILRKKDK